MIEPLAEFREKIGRDIGLRPGGARTGAGRDNAR
jgi:hypothetical protein